MRYLRDELNRVIKNHQKMVFISGPRQSGKTTLAQAILKEKSIEGSYFNWDVDQHRRLIVKDPTNFWRKALSPNRSPLLVLDEIHKYPRWKRFLKGLFDASKDEVKVIVTGSGRLDTYQRGGDSLVGRYFPFRLHPFSVGELLRADRQSVREPKEVLEAVLDQIPGPEASDALNQIDQFTGFPEPLFAANNRTLNQWRRVYNRLILREDLRDLTRIHEIGLLEAMVEMLPDRIGSPLSLNALREDLNVAFGTVRLWLNALSRLYFLFEIKPYAAKLPRLLRREGKYYLFNTAFVDNPGARFENLIALHLKKAIDAWNDFGFGNFDLFYLRDKERREADFLVTDDHKPYFLVEAKTAGHDMSPPLAYFKDRLNPKIAFQVIRDAETDYLRQVQKDVYLVSAARFLAQLP